jgi:hypothetical protein
MKTSYLLLFYSCLATTILSQANYSIQAVPFTSVKINDRFWKPRLESVRTVTLPYTFRQCEETGRINNFEIAGGTKEGSFCTEYPFDDSDVYKIIEGAAYSLQAHPDAELRAYVDGLIAKIAAAQETDGYLYSWRTIYDKGGSARENDASKGRGLDMAGERRWFKTDQHSHELYNVGHLYEAAVAWYQATGNRNLLDVALKNADLVERTFGHGKLEKSPGHQEIEIGLMKLFHLTREKKYLNLAKFFLDVRGYGDAYQQNHQKVSEQREAVGHAVRACYMYSAMADVAASSGDQTYLPALDAIWNDVVGKKMYVTGGIGSAGSNEGFTTAYDLPNYSAYCETCASIAFVLWNQRMFQLTGESKYIDVLERTLYNALNAGLSLSGDRFFYPNPLESRKNVERSPWFACACCPSNVTRFFPSIPGYVFARKGNELFINLFVDAETTLSFGGKRNQVTIHQHSSYPWEGKVLIEVKPQKYREFTIKIRIPGWARGEAVPGDLYRFIDEKTDAVTILLNDKPQNMTMENGYAVLKRKWKKGDKIELELPMLVRKVMSHENVTANTGRVAMQRGPIVFTLEGKDQPQEQVASLIVPEFTMVHNQYEPDLLGGVQTLNFSGFQLQNLDQQSSMSVIKSMELKAIPYYTWANHGKDNMMVWMPTKAEVARPLIQTSLAAQSKITASEGIKGTPDAIADQYLPKSSADKENPFVHWWPKFGTIEWLQYDFAGEEKVSSVRVYWFDDEVLGGGCRIPKSWRILYFDNGNWKPVFAAEGFSITKNGWDEVWFEPVKTKSLRLEVVSQEGVSTGVHEWEVK